MKSTGLAALILSLVSGRPAELSGSFSHGRSRRAVEQRAGRPVFEPDGYLEAALQYVYHAPEFSQRYGDRFELEDAFGRVSLPCRWFSEGKAECFVRIAGEIWQLHLCRKRLRPWCVQSVCRVETAQEEIQKML